MVGCNISITEVFAPRFARLAGLLIKFKYKPQSNYHCGQFGDYSIFASPTIENTMTSLSVEENKFNQQNGYI